MNKSSLHNLKRLCYFIFKHKLFESCLCEDLCLSFLKFKFVILEKRLNMNPKDLKTATKMRRALH